MIKELPSNSRFTLARQKNSWITGRFRVLDALNIPHLVSTRHGPDCHIIRHQPDDAVQQVARALDAEQGAYLDQVHGPTALYCSHSGLTGQADALYTDHPGLVLAGKSADCPLILVAEKHGKAVGFAHASWRSTVAGVTSNLIHAMEQDLLCRPQDLVACICPSAGPECYEVGPEVRDQALAHLGVHAKSFFVAQKRGKFLFDLWQANTHCLVQSGLTPDNIHNAGLCTLCHNELFPSYRKEGDTAGRFVAAICRHKD